jgi:glycosyltransferase involved in cell wall biosynthesis
MRCPTFTELPSVHQDKVGWPWTEESPQLRNTTPNGSPRPKISIVTPSYNQGQFIEETIRSVLLQGYPDLEYIIIDGDSTDDSVEIIKKYEPWLAYWVSEPDRGQSHAINKGWRRAQGEVIAYLNSDDLLAPGALGHVAHTFMSAPEAGLVYGDCSLIDAKGGLIDNLKSRPYNRAGLLVANYILQPSAFIGRKAFRHVGEVDESFHMAMDYDYWVRVAMAGFDMKYVPQALSSARLTPNTKSASLVLSFLPDILRVLDSVYESGLVPGDVRRAKRSAYANAWRVGGVRYFNANMRRPAITAMLRSLCWKPMYHWKTSVIALLIILQSILGVNWWSPDIVEKAVSAYARGNSKK